MSLIQTHIQNPVEYIKMIFLQNSSRLLAVHHFRKKLLGIEKLIG